MNGRQELEGLRRPEVLSGVKGGVRSRLITAVKALTG